MCCITCWRIAGRSQPSRANCKFKILTSLFGYFCNVWRELIALLILLCSRVINGVPSYRQHSLVRLIPQITTGSVVPRTIRLGRQTCNFFSLIFQIVFSLSNVFLLSSTSFSRLSADNVFKMLTR